jgi:hypothetical protein
MEIHEKEGMKIWSATYQMYIKEAQTVEDAIHKADQVLQEFNNRFGIK